MKFSNGQSPASMPVNCLRLFLPQNLQSVLCVYVRVYSRCIPGYIYFVVNCIIVGVTQSKNN